MAAALLIDFGSTYTKLRALDLDGLRMLASGQGPSTVTTDVTLGLDAALADLERKLGSLPAFKYRLASSSAAGGLRMVTIGLVRELTAEAARQAALGAGAKVVGTFAYRLTEADDAKIAALSPDIILLAGGTDGGNSEVIRHNGKRIAASSLTCPVVIAGNRDVGEELLAERFIAGRELTCAVMGDRVLGVTEIVPDTSLGFYNYEAKYASGGSHHVVPAPLLPDVYQSVQKLTQMAYRSLACRGVARADFRYDDTEGGTGELVCLEVNTQPGMTATSLVPELAAHAGISLPELVGWMVEDASCNR